MAKQLQNIGEKLQTVQPVKQKGKNRKQEKAGRHNLDANAGNVMKEKGRCDTRRKKKNQAKKWNAV
jgi:hypothetical protein